MTSVLPPLFYSFEGDWVQRPLSKDICLRIVIIICRAMFSLAAYIVGLPASLSLHLYSVFLLDDFKMPLRGLNYRIFLIHIGIFLGGK